MSKNHVVPRMERRRHARCQQCGEVSELLEYHSFDLAANPTGKETLLEGAFFHWCCPKCGFQADIAYPCWYLDPKAGLEIALIPDISTGSEGDVLQWTNQYLEQLNRLELSDQTQLTRRAVGTFFAMQELVHIQDAGLDDRVIQLLKPLMIGQLQSQGELVWNGFFVGAAQPDPQEQEPLDGVLYASEDPEKSAYGQTIYWFDIHLTNRQVIRMGVNEVLFRLCQGLLERSGHNQPADSKFHLYDLDWAIDIHNQAYQK